jgi:flavin-dependent dehydrogenase
MTRSIDIVGAGLAGLVAGITLAGQGFRVRIFEAKDTIGGGMSFADATLMNPVVLERVLGINIREALTPWKSVRVWAYGKRFDLAMPHVTEACTLGRGRGELSLENVLSRQALEKGVEVILGRKLSMQEIAELPAGTIIATGLTRSSFELLDIPHRPFYGHMATGCSDPSRPQVIVYFDRFTREYGYYAQCDRSSVALVFRMDRPLREEEKAAFRKKLAQDNGIEMDGWNDDISRWAAWPLKSWNNRNLFREGKILAGTLAGVVSPVLNFGVNGALVSGRIAAMAVIDPEAARQEFRRLAPLYLPQFVFRRFREYAPIPLLKLGTRTILSTYSPGSFHHALSFALWPPGLKPGRV